MLTCYYPGKIDIYMYSNYCLTLPIAYRGRVYTMDMLVPDVHMFTPIINQTHIQLIHYNW